MPSDAELSRMLAAAIAAGTLTPIVCVSAKKNVGIDELLELLTVAALSPIAVRAPRAIMAIRNAQPRRRRALSRTGLQNADRSLRTTAELYPRLRGDAQTRRDRPHCYFLMKPIGVINYLHVRP